MRLFVGIELGDAVIQAAAEIIAELRRRAVRLAPAARVSWLTTDWLHVTLAFIGHADAARTSAIAGCLRAPFGGPTFDMNITGLGVFPGRGLPRVLWAGIEEGRDRLLHLETELHVRCPPALIPSDERPYHPHLTLARVRDAAGLSAASLLEGLERIALGTTRVEAITLFESRLSPKGPTYVPLQRTGVAGGGDR